MTPTEIDKWHQEENEWWDEFSELMSEQWRLTPKINQVIRDDMETRYNSFLFQENGSILDVGCGSGWLALKFAKQGMDALGIDFSQEQIAQANKYKEKQQVDNVDFICTDFVEFEYEKYVGKFDSIFLNAFLHHLPFEELEKIFKIISKVSKKEAKIYLYEPIMFTQNRSKKYITKIIISIYSKIFSALLWRAPSLLNWWNRVFKDAMEKGYNGMSPNEASIDIDRLAEVLKKENIEIINIKPEHYQSLPFAILSYSMNKPYSNIYNAFLPLIYAIDKMIFKFLDWKSLGKKRSFLLCSVQLKKL